MTAPAAGTRLDALTGLRFFAALAVVLLHVGDEIIGGGAAPALFTGHVGVTFFFVLSGFVLTWSYRPGSKTAFYRRRFARIYPLYIVTWVLAWVVLIAASRTVFQVGPFLAGALLLHAWIPSETYFFAGNGPGWSLSVEAFYYAVFPFLIAWAFNRSGRTLARLVALACSAYLLVAVGLAAIGSGGFVLLYINPAGRLIDFVLGIAIALAVRRGHACPVPVSVPLIAVGVLYVAASWLNVTRAPELLGQRFVTDVIFLPIGCLLIWAVATRTGDRSTRVLSRRLLVVLGEWSFALYLVHPILLAAVRAVLNPLEQPFVVRLPVAAGFVVAAVAASGVAYVGLERPIEKRLRGARPRPIAQSAAEQLDQVSSR